MPCGMWVHFVRMLVTMKLSHINVVVMVEVTHALRDSLTGH